LKNFLLVAVLLLCASIFAAVHFNANERILRVGVECDYPPNNWEEERMSNINVPIVNKSGFYADGYDIQIAKIVAKSIGAELKIKKIAWEDLIPALNRREIDAIFSGMLDTSERKKLIDFSESYEERMTEYAILVQKDGPFADAKNLTDFVGARFVGQENSNFDDAIEQITGAIHLPPVAIASKMLEKLLKNEADGIVTDVELINSYVKNNPSLTGIIFPKDKSLVFDYTGVCAGVRKSDVNLTKEINVVLKNIPMQERQKIMDNSRLRSEN